MTRPSIRTDFHAVFAALPGLYLVIAPDAPTFTILAASDAYLRVAMRTRDQIVGRPLFDAFPDNPDDPQATGVRNLRASLETVLRTGLPHEMPVQRYDIARPPAEGSGYEQRYWKPVNAPVFGEDGQVCHIVQRVEDVTADVRSRAALFEAQERHRVVLEAVDEGVTVHDAAGAIVMVNPSAERILGLTLDQMQGVNSFDPRWRAVTEDGADFPGDLHPPQVVVREGRSVSNAVMGIHRGDGSFIWVSANAIPLRDPGGRVTGAACSFFDVTERKQAEAALREAEQRYRAVFEVSQDAKIIYTPDGTVVDANPAACRMYGFLLHEIVGLHAPDVIHPDARPMFREFLRVAGAGGEYHCETVDRRRDGTVFDVEVNGSSFSYQGRTHLLAVIRDISGRKQADAALRESEGRFRLMADAVPQIVWITDAEGRVQFFNQQWSSYTGLDYVPATADDVAATVVHPGDAAATMAAFEKARRSGETFLVEHRIRSAAGKYRWFLVRGQPHRDPQTGDITRWFGASVDIHDRRLAEEALRESEGHARRIIDNTLAFVGVMTPGGTLTEANATALRAGGLRCEDVVGRKFWDCHWWSYDPAVQARLQDAVNRAAGGEVVRYDVVVRMAGDTRMPIDFMLSPVRDGQGRVTYLIPSGVDIAERKRAEDALREAAERFRFLAESMPQKMFTATSGGEVDYFNGQWSAFTGLSFEQIRDWGWTQFIHPDDVDENVRVWRHSIDTGEPFQFEHRFRRHDGVYRWHLSRAHAMRDAAGNVRMWIGSNTDIDEVKRTEEALRQAKEEAESASRMKDEFLATLGHELRTPLNAILGWSQIIKRPSAAAEDVAQGIDVIERNARAQAQIIEDLLDMSRIISGKVRLDVQCLSLEPILRTAVESATPAADAKGIRIQAVLDPLAGPVNGDPGRLQQVMWNLLTNAVKFTPRGGRVQVLLERVNSQVEISVADTGEGIRPEFLPHVFDRFRQADASTTRRHGGLGLGLSIVKQLVELHGGSVRAKSAGEGQGATFIVSLPLAVIHQPESPPEPERRHPKAGGEAHGLYTDTCADIAGVKVLVVDDEPDARTLVRRLLEDCHAVVVTAASAAEGLELLQAERPDVVVSDIGLPTRDGYAFMRQVRALADDRGGRTPALALTAYARAEDRMRAIRAGFQMHVPKPVEPAELITMVASLAGRA